MWSWRSVNAISLLAYLLAVVAALDSVSAWIVPATVSTTTTTTTAPPRLSSSSTTTTTTLFMAAPPLLENWKILKSGAVMGVAKNHPDPDIDDGDTITTSPLKAPDTVGPRKIVVTESGSRYKLGEPLLVVKPKAARVVINGAAAAPPAKKKEAPPPPSAAKKKKKVMAPTVVKKTWADIKREYNLNGDKIGNYLLSGKPQRSTSGKSQIWTAYRADKEGNPTGREAVKIKVSNDREKLKQEAATYRKVSSGKFVKAFEFYSPAGKSGKFASQAALVIESGGANLREFVGGRREPLTGKALRDTAVAAIQCVQAIHGAGLVWTDMKPENFVLFTDGDDVSKGMKVKGIDLESAIRVRGNPIDYSPEATPPEFAQALLAGEGPYFKLDFSYDIWSFGILLYEISTGQSAFKGQSQNQITKTLSVPGFEVDVSGVPDSKLRDLISQCLRTDPKRRPSTTQILLHPYFLTTGIGGFSF